jgi:hypothetical protein
VTPGSPIREERHDHHHPLPSGHTELFPWEDNDGQPFRDFKGSAWHVEASDCYDTPRDIEVSLVDRSLPRSNDSRRWASGLTCYFLRCF